MAEVGIQSQLLGMILLMRCDTCIFISEFPLITVADLLLATFFPKSLLFLFFFFFFLQSLKILKNVRKSKSFSG